MGRLLHAAAITGGRFIFSQCTRTSVLNRNRFDRRGGPVIVACTHISHLEPAVVSCSLRHPIEWMARIEFFRHPVAATVLRAVESFSVNRQGVPVSAVRTSIDRLRRGRVVGIFPDGGVVTGRDATFRGGAFKAGACVIAMRAGVPVLPIVVLGTEKLTRVEPWLPLRRAQLWLNVGRPVAPPVVTSRRERRCARKRMAEQVRIAFVETYRELLHRCRLDDAAVP